MKKILPLVIVAFLSSLMLNAQVETNEKGLTKTVKSKNLLNTSNKNLDFSWQDPETDLSNNHNEDSKDSKMVMGDDETLYVIYNDDRDQEFDDATQKVMVTKKTVGGTWTTPECIDAGWPHTPYNEDGVNATMPNIAVSPNGDLHACWLMWDFPGRILAYAKYDAASSTWLQPDTISQANGSLDSWYAPEIYSTDDNNPVIVWAQDDRTGSNEAYMKYFDGTNWSDDISISVEDEFEAYDPAIVKMPNQKCLITFIEQTDADNQALKYCIYDETDHSISTLQIVPETTFGTDLYYNNFDLELKNDNEVLMSMWTYETGTNPVVNKFIVWNYDINADQFTKSAQEFVNSESGSINQKFMDIAFNSNGECAFVYSNSYDDHLHFVEFDETTGFGTPQQISTMPAVPAGAIPSIAFDADDNLHVIFDDNRFDQNNDGYLDRDVLYTKASPNTTFIKESITNNNTSYVLSPNPAQNQITISNVQLTINDVEIIDITGKNCLSNIIVRGNTIDISNLENGVYFLKVGQETKKFIKN